MKTKTIYISILFFISSFIINAQTFVNVTSVEEAMLEVSKGNKVSLSLLNDESKIFPPSFFYLPKDKLTGLIIDGCGYEKLPQKLSEYKNVVYFRYSWFRFSKSPISNLPDVLFKLNKLETLIFESEIIGQVSNKIAKLQELKKLKLYRTKLKKFPKAILELKNLKFLDLSCAEFESIPDEISKLKKLNNLFFDGGACGATPIVKIPDSIGDLTELKSINFGYSKESIGYLPKSFFKLKNLEYFGCYGCKLKGFPEELGELKKLEIIQMMNMDSFDVFPESLFKLPKLKRFNFLIPGGKASKALVAQKKRLNNWGLNLEDYKIDIEHWEY